MKRILLILSILLVVNFLQAQERIGELCYSQFAEVEDLSNIKSGDFRRGKKCIRADIENFIITIEEIEYRIIDIDKLENDEGHKISLFRTKPIPELINLKVGKDYAILYSVKKDKSLIYKDKIDP